MTHLPIIGITCRRDESARWHWPNQAGGNEYIQALVQAGGAPLLIPLGMGHAALLAIYQLLDGLLLPGGEDIDPAQYGQAPHPKLGATDPLRDQDELFLARRALADGLPILAICRGIQLLNVAAGGTLIQDISAQVPAATLHPTARSLDELKVVKHEIEIEAGSWLARALETRRCRVNTGHHQAVEQVAPGFGIVARAPDGIVEAIERREGFALGVQFHPEQLLGIEAWVLPFFKAFIGEARPQG